MWRTPGTCGLNPNSCGANCGTRRMSNFLRPTPCASLNGGHRTLPPSRKRGGRKAEAQRARGSSSNEDPHSDFGRGVGPVTGSVGSEGEPDRGGRHRLHLKPRASWCSYHREALTKSPNLSRLAGRGSGPSWNEDLHSDFGRGVGPVTGAAGSEGTRGRGGRHRFRLKAEGLLTLIPSRGPHPLSGPHGADFAPVPQVAARLAAHCSRA